LESCQKGKISLVFFKPDITFEILKPKTMLKHLRFVFATCFTVITINIYAQNPVPNPGFENWTMGNPDSWLTNNIPGFAIPVTSTTPANGGAMAVKGSVVTSLSGDIPPLLYSTDISGTGFPVTQLYSTFSFYYKFNQIGPSEFFGVVTISDATNTGIGAGGTDPLLPTSSYTLVNVPIYYFAPSPARAIITFAIGDSVTGNPVAGNYFVVDDVSLSGLVGIEENQPLVYAIEKVQPNPARDMSFVYYSLTVNDDINFTLYDVTGKKFQQLNLQNEIAGRHKAEFDFKDVPAGLYYLEMSSSSGRRTTAVQVVK
jgi:Secretion system C-terminal sorting domain